VSATEYREVRTQAELGDYGRALAYRIVRVRRLRRAQRQGQA
jgi:hypothetical protein